MLDKKFIPNKVIVNQEQDDQLPGPMGLFAHIPWRDKAYQEVKKDLLSEGQIKKDDDK